MAGLKSKIFNYLIRYNHLFRGKLKKETFDHLTSIADFRERCEKGAARRSKIPDGISIRAQEIEGMKCEWLVPDGADPRKVILYIHGGGYVSGSCSDHRGFVSKFARYTGVINLLFEYRLAPEHPFPAALDDTVKIYQWLLSAGYEPWNIVMAGESAGGGLCLATLLAIKNRQISLPVAAVAISPWTDLTCSSESYSTKNKLSPAPLNSWVVFRDHYCGDQNPSLPLISPLFGDLAGLPPLLINSGMNDELYEDGEKFAQKAKEAGVEITFRAGPGMIHCYPLLAPMFSEATAAMNEIVDFVRKYFKLT
jgi:epsilon-lactone hydrolase